jgi:hypothetical protein
MFDATSAEDEATMTCSRVRPVNKVRRRRIIDTYTLHHTLSKSAKVRGKNNQSINVLIVIVKYSGSSGSFVTGIRLDWDIVKRIIKKEIIIYFTGTVRLKVV